MADKITIEGREYVSPDCCTFGDYGGSGSYGLSNIRAIIESAKEAGETFETSFQDVSRAAEKIMSSYAMDSEVELRTAVKADPPPLLLHATGDWSSETVYILADSELARETLESLENYASLDDDGVSAIEMEWEYEAWADWLRSDLERAAWPENEEPEDSVAYAAMTDDDKWSACRHAMEVENEYFESEHNGSHARVERFAATYRETIEAMLKGETINSLSRKRWPTLYASRA